MEADPDISSVIAAAERAASDGDYAGAEAHLRQAAALQEARLGPTHPDLANTLNNLGVAREQAGRLDEAEASYRRAYAIALEALPADHPFVVRSAENLRDFCAARGRPLDLPDPAPTPAPGAATEPETAGAAASVPDAGTPSDVVPVEATGARAPVAAARADDIARTPPAVPARASRARADEHAADVVWVESPSATDDDRPASRSSGFFWVVAVVVLVAVLLFWFGPWRSGAGVPGTAGPDAASARPDAPVAADPAASVDDELPAPGGQAPAADAAPAPAAPVTAVPPDDAIAPSSPVAPSAAAASAASAVELAAVDVCRNFLPRGAEWRCDRVEDVTAPGALVYYTRIRSPRPTTVVHRWYRGDALVQRVELRIGANPGAGYRTYSRNTVTAATAGNWRVELVDASGTVLREHRFVVR